MMKSNLHIFNHWLILLLWCFSIAVWATNGKDNDNETQPVLEFDGKVVYVDLEGGFYGIESNTGEKYLPFNLSDEFKLDGMTVRVTANKSPSRMGIQMWGTYIDILTIEEIFPEEATTANL